MGEDSPRISLDTSGDRHQFSIFQPGTVKAILPGIIATAIGVGLFIAGLVIGTGGTLGLALTILGAAVMTLGILMSVIVKSHHNKQEKESNMAFEFPSDLAF